MSASFVKVYHRDSPKVTEQVRIVSLSPRVIAVRIHGQEVGFARRDGSVLWGDEGWSLVESDLRWYAPQFNRLGDSEQAH